MSQIFQALKSKNTGKVVYIFTQPGSAFQDNDHDLVTVEVNITDSICATCKVFNTCGSGLKGHDKDCSSYENLETTTPVRSCETCKNNNNTLPCIACDEDWSEYKAI